MTLIMGPCATVVDVGAMKLYAFGPNNDGTLEAYVDMPSNSYRCPQTSKLSTVQ